MVRIGVLRMGRVAAADAERDMAQGTAGNPFPIA
jgi:hypothetical protein